VTASRRFRTIALLSVILVASILFVGRPGQPETVPEGEAPTGATSTSVSGQEFTQMPSESSSPTSPEVRPIARLFTPFDPPNASFLTSANPAPALSVAYARIDRALIEGKESPFWQRPGEGRIALPLPDGREIVVEIDHSEQFGPNRFTSVGSVPGSPLSQVVFGYTDGFLNVSVIDPAGINYGAQGVEEEIVQFYESDMSLPANCGVESTLDTTEIVRSGLALEGRRFSLDLAGDVGEAPPRNAFEASSGRNARVDIMMLYTQAIFSNLSGSARVAAIQSRFDTEVAKINGALDSSGIEARVRLVRIAETTYPDDHLTSIVSNLQGPMLQALAQTSDGVMDEIHALRDSAGADLVFLIHARHDTNTAGVAYVPSLETPDRYFNPQSAVGVVDHFYIQGSFHVLSHELGHTMGNVHEREAYSTSTDANIIAAYAAGTLGAQAFSYGYVYTSGGATYRDIMARSGSGTRLPYFSNPNVTPTETPGVPIGIAVGQAESAYSALTFDNLAFEVGAYRLQKVSAVGAGTLNAVATRAFVGSLPEEQLIGGFIINGSVPKRVLIRGVGPALSGVVPGFLTDPFLTLNRLSGSGGVVATNNDWGTEPNAAAIALGNGTRGSTGSRDSALLLDLDPGAYSANITSFNGGTGDALIEVYEMEATGNRIIALATRGYAAKGREMIAGFIVNGVAGTTKRVVIRVQGPTLGRPPYNVPGSMFDPFLEIYNQQGDLIMVNDDWSLGNTGGDDFQPTVRYYSEQEISNAGMAPSNRREPCIMVDLPPGLYTAVLRPFEDLTASPPQTASPGVAIVEVYEIQ
jgi:hypothetical protein